MKKLFLFAALFAAVTLNAKEMVIDLSKWALIKTDGATVNASINADVVTVNYTTTAGWDDMAGVSYALDNLNVTNIAYEYKGDALLDTWTSFLVYLEDVDGTKWFNQEADLHVSGWEGEWSSQSYFPTDALWATPSYSAGEKPFTSIGFMVNGGSATSTFAIKNVKLTLLDETAIENTTVEAKAVKVIRDGQVLILRDGKAFNALGVEMK